MNEYIDLMIGAYIITRMLENVENNNLSRTVNIASFITLIVVVGCMGKILKNINLIGFFLA